MWKRPAMPLIVLAVAGFVLYLVFRSASNGRELHTARRLGEMDRALLSAAAAAGDRVRAALDEHRRRGGPGLPIPIEIDGGRLDDEEQVHHHSDAIDAARVALRGSPDPHQLVLLDPDRIAWLVAGWDTRGAVAIASVEAILELTVDGYAAGYWMRTEAKEGRRLPEPFPPVLLTLSNTAHDAVREEATREFRRLLVAPLFLALLTFIAGGLVWLGLRREARIKQRREAFLSAVTHELKTPIANITLFAETLREHGRDDPERLPEFTGVILAEADRLFRRVQQLLDVAAGKSPGLHSGAPFDVAAAALVIVERQRERGVDIRSESLDRVLWAKGPAGLFERALEEVLQNARTFAPGSEVTVACREADRKIVISVDDGGPGVPRAERKRVFEPFVRLGDDMTNPAPGTGLGLALVRQCMEGCGGRATIESAPGGEGTRVSLHLTAAIGGAARA